MADGEGFHLASMKIKGGLGREFQPLDMEPSVYVPAPARPRFEISVMRRGEPVERLEAPLVGGSPRTMDLTAHDGPSCLCALPRARHATAVFASCRHCSRTALIPLCVGQEAPGAVRVECRRAKR